MRSQISSDSISGNTWCVFRTDRIGDLILTLPLASAIKRHRPKDRVVFCVQQYTSPLVRLCPDVDGILEIEDRDLPISCISQMSRRLRDEGVSVAILAFPRPGLAAAAAWAGIPERIGTAHRWYSGLFTKRHPDHRSEARMSEAEYNLRLLAMMNIPAPASFAAPLRIPEGLRDTARNLLAEAGLDSRTPFLVVHPGSGGSARDFDARSMGRVALSLIQRYPGMAVLVTGSEAEKGIMERTRKTIGDSARLLPRSIRLDELAAVLHEARLCLANSTGPLHIASALCVPVLGFYPFQRVCHPRRWGPVFGPAEILTPPHEPECEACKRESCPDHDRMDRITIESATEAGFRLLAGTIGVSGCSNDGKE